MEMLKSSYLFDNVGYQNVLHLRNVLKLQFKTTRQNNEIYKIHHIYTYYTEDLLPYILIITTKITFTGTCARTVVANTSLASSLRLFRLRLQAG